MKYIIFLFFSSSLFAAMCPISHGPTNCSPPSTSPGTGCTWVSQPVASIPFCDSQIDACGTTWGCECINIEWVPNCPVLGGPTLGGGSSFSGLGGGFSSSASAGGPSSSSFMGGGGSFSPAPGGGSSGVITTTPTPTPSPGSSPGALQPVIQLTLNHFTQNGVSLAGSNDCCVPSANNYAQCQRLVYLQSSTPAPTRFPRLPCSTASNYATLGPGTAYVNNNCLMSTHNNNFDQLSTPAPNCKALYLRMRPTAYFSAILGSYTKTYVQNNIIDNTAVPASNLTRIIAAPNSY